MTKHIQTCGNGRGGPRAGAGRPGTGKEASFDDIRKKLNIPKKPTYNEDVGLYFCVSHCFCDNCPEEKQKNAELACADIVTRYVSATNVVLSMEHSEEELMVLIDKCVNVSDTLKDRLQVEWETEHMACVNADLVEFNSVLTACTGSNTAPYLLGAGQSASAALFYLVKYLTKESGV
jgi:hypothetical protein